MSQEFGIMDAFLALKDIDDEAVAGMIKPRDSKKLEEGKQFAIGCGSQDLQAAREFLEEEKADTELEVIDVDADSVEHLKNNSEYVGQGILQCKKCLTNRFVDMDKLVASEEDSEVYNIEEECPHCHTQGSGYELIGQVGKVTKESSVEPQAVETGDEATGEEIENDEKTDDVAFENDLEPEEEEQDDASSEEEQSEVEQPIDIDSTIEDDEEKDGMETTSSEEEEDDLDLPSLGDGVDPDDVKPDDSEDEEDVKESLNESVEMNADAKEAWLMNKVITGMNNEEAYFGTSWLYYWPDGEDEEACQRDFGENREAFEELKDHYLEIYKQYHRDGLYDVDQETIDYAHKTDELLELAKIDVLEAFKPKLEESLEVTQVADILKVIIDSDKIEKVIAVDVSDEDNEKKVFEGPIEDLTPDIIGSELANFTVEDGYLTCNIDREDDDAINKLGYILNTFGDDTTEKVSLVDAGTFEELFTGTKEDAIKQFGNAKFVAFETPAVIKFNIKNSALNELEETLEISDKDTLIENIFKANNLSEHRLGNKQSNEYWIKESIETGDDLDYIFEHFIKPIDNKTLVKEFKQVTGFKTKFDEAYEEEFGEAFDFNPDDIASDTLEAEADNQLTEDLDNSMIFNQLCLKTGFENNVRAQGELKRIKNIFITNPENANDIVKNELEKLYQDTYNGYPFMIDSIDGIDVKDDTIVYIDGNYIYGRKALANYLKPKTSGDITPAGGGDYHQAITDAEVKKEEAHLKRLQAEGLLDKALNNFEGIKLYLASDRSSSFLDKYFPGDYVNYDNNPDSKRYGLGTTCVVKDKELHDALFPHHKITSKDGNVHSNALAAALRSYDIPVIAPSNIRKYFDQEAAATVDEQLLEALENDLINEGINDIDFKMLIGLCDQLGIETLGDLENFRKEHPEGSIVKALGNYRNELGKDFEVKAEPAFESFKTRKELAEAITECKNNNRPYSVRKSIKEGFRYDLLIKEAVEEDKSDKILKFINDNCEFVDEPFLGKCYITPDGRYLKIKKNHSEIEQLLVDNGLSDNEIVVTAGSKTLDDLNFVRCDTDKYFVALPCKRLTKEQDDALLAWLDLSAKYCKAMTIMTADGQVKDYFYDDEFIVDDVFSRIRIFYIKGILNEQKDPNIKRSRNKLFERKTKATVEVNEELLTLAAAGTTVGLGVLTNLIADAIKRAVDKRNKEAEDKAEEITISDSVVKDEVEKAVQAAIEEKDSVSDKDKVEIEKDTFAELAKEIEQIKADSDEKSIIDKVKDFFKIHKLKKAQKDEAKAQYLQDKADKLSTPSDKALKAQYKAKLAKIKTEALNEETETALTVAQDYSPAQQETMEDILRIADDISEAVEHYYGIDADPRIVVADILQDLSLIAGNISVEDLPDTVANNATRQMFKDYESAYEMIDSIISFFSGESIRTTREEKLKQAIQMLKSPNFSKENIFKGIGSTKFLAAVQQGQIPYIDEDTEPLLLEEFTDIRESFEEDKEDFIEYDLSECITCDDSDVIDEAEAVEIDTDKFDTDINDYLDEAYEDTLVYSTTAGQAQDNGTIILEGYLNRDGEMKEVTFTLTPKNNNHVFESAERFETDNCYDVSCSDLDENFEFSFKDKIDE